MVPTTRCTRSGAWLPHTLKDHDDGERDPVPVIETEQAGDEHRDTRDDRDAQRVLEHDRRRTQHRLQRKDTGSAAVGDVDAPRRGPMRLAVFNDSNDLGAAFA